MSNAKLLRYTLLGQYIGCQCQAKSQGFTFYGNLSAIDLNDEYVIVDLDGACKLPVKAEDVKLILNPIENISEEVATEIVKLRIKEYTKEFEITSLKVYKVETAKQGLYMMYIDATIKHRLINSLPILEFFKITISNWGSINTYYTLVGSSFGDELSADNYGYFIAQILIKNAYDLPDIHLGKLTLKQAGLALYPEDLKRKSGSPVRIQRSRKKGWRMPENTVYVGRPVKYFSNDAQVGKYSIWLGRDCLNIVDVVLSFQKKVEADPLLRRQIRMHLKGKNLACWCKPGQPCHADILLKIANE